MAFAASSLSQAVAYILVTVIASPAICALGGAFVPILSSGEIKNYWVSWAQWYSANALAAVTLGPVFLTWFGQSPRLTPLTNAGKAEALILLLSLIGVCAIAFGTVPG